MQSGLALLVLLMALVAPGTGAAQHAVVAPTPAPAFQASGIQLEDPPPIAAKFGASTTTAGSPMVVPSEWYLLRSPGRIERVQPDAGTAEIWERDDRGNVSLKRVFRDDARIVEYTPGNLRAMQLEEHWEALGAVVDPRRVRALKHGVKVDTPFGLATIFEGVVTGVATKVWWLDELSVPVRIIEQPGRRRAQGAPQQPSVGLAPRGAGRAGDVRDDRRC